MKSYPLYPDENEVIFMALFGGGAFVIILSAFLVSYFQSPKEARSFELQPLIKQKLIGFIFMLFAFYLGSTYFLMETLFVDKKGKEFSVSKTLMGKALQEKKFPLAPVKEISIIETRISGVYEIVFNGPAFSLVLGKGELEFAEKLGKNLSLDLEIPMKRRP